MAKKRPTLDAFLNSQSENIFEEETELKQGSMNNPEKGNDKAVGKTFSDKENVGKPSGKQETFRYMLYLPLSVYDQLQSMVFEEQRGQLKRRKTHDYLLEAIDLLFEKKGLKSISELAEKR